MAGEVFISYSHSDGEAFADRLRTRLESEGIPLWQDRVGMEGGRDWWLQITEVLKQVEFMVLVMTPNALQSPIIRKEWRYARQQGVCVYPVKGAVDERLDYSSLPRWMRDVHFYDVGDLNENSMGPQWRKLVNDLNTRCQQPRVPFMVEDLPEHFVPRPKEFDRLHSWLLDEQRGEPIAITAALRGAGGYGKTTLAKALCHNEAVQEAFDDGILWVTLGENPGDLIGRVQDLIQTLDETQPKFTGIDAAVARLVELLADRHILIVIDNVWEGSHLKPFMQGGPRCARLITTRILDTLPADAKDVQVDAMQPSEATGLLRQGLPPGNENELRNLAARLGEWPLLLTLANGQLRHRVQHTKQPLPDALTSVNKALDKHGLETFDPRKPNERNQAVARTLSVSFEILDKESERLRFHELAVFPEDVEIPLATLQRLWGKTGGLDELDTEDLCDRLYRLSLLLRFDLTMCQIRLHDVVSKYLAHEQRTTLVGLNSYLLDAHRPSSGDWADLGQDEPYFWDHLAYHLHAAGRVQDLVATVKDLRYVATKTFVRGVSAVEADLFAAESTATEDPILRLLRRGFAQSAHIVNRCDSVKNLMAALCNRLQHLEQLTPLTLRLAQTLPGPYLTALDPMPDLPHPALLRTLFGHTEGVSGCAISPDGSFVVSAACDDTLKVWDVETGIQRLTLSGHTDVVNCCAISSDGSFIVSASNDKTLKVWDLATGTQRLTLSGHTETVNGCAISPDGSFIVSASTDKTLKVWDAKTGAERLTLSGHTQVVNCCAISPDGSFIVSGSNDETLKVWDAITGSQTLALSDHTEMVDALKVLYANTGNQARVLSDHTGVVNGCAISPDGSFIVSASTDKTLKVWNTKTGAERLTLSGHTEMVNGCAISQDSNFIVSASNDNTLKVWDAKVETHHFDFHHLLGIGGPIRTMDSKSRFMVSASNKMSWTVWNAKTATFSIRYDLVNGCAISPDGNFIVSASNDKTLKLWDLTTGTQRLTLSGHTETVNGCAISPDGSFIVSASNDKTLKVWDARTGTGRLTLSGHTQEVSGCAISLDSSFIVSASCDDTLKIWDVETGAQRLTLSGHTEAVNCCAISPDGKFIVSASNDKTLKIWDIETGTQRLTLSGHTEAVNCCAISPDGKFIVSASNDKTLKIWDSKTAYSLATLYTDSPVRACDYSTDNEHIHAVADAGFYFLRLVRRPRDALGNRSKLMSFLSNQTGLRTLFEHLRWVFLESLDRKRAPMKRLGFGVLMFTRNSELERSANREVASE